MQRAQGLSKREMEVMQCLRRGMTTREASAWMGIAPKTLQTHLANIYKRLGVNSRLAALYALGYMTKGDNVNEELTLSMLTDVQLLALCVWGEARGEAHVGKLAVAHVVLNRVGKKSWYGRSIRDVIVKPYQFSFMQGLEDVFVLAADDPAAVVAYLVLSEHTIDPTKGATHFHARYVMPDWARALRFKVAIGNHLFYEE